MFVTISDHLEKKTFPKLAVTKVPFLEDAVCNSLRWACWAMGHFRVWIGLMVKKAQKQ